MNATPTGTKTGKEIVQSNKADKINALTISREVNCHASVKFNTPDLEQINGIIETNQKCEQLTHITLNQQSSMNISVRIRRMQNIA